MSEITTPHGVPSVVTASRFVLQADLMQNLAYFTELGGITSEVESTEYITTNAKNPTEVIHSRQFGKTKPPTITLKRGVDGGDDLWVWHQFVLQGSDAARCHATLTMMDAGGNKKGMYDMQCCWPTKLEISGMKAGASEVVYENVTLTCDKLIYIAGAG